MGRRSLILLTVVATMAAMAALAARGQSGGPQGWAGTPPSPAPPLEPRVPATVKEGEVWIPPLPKMESVAPPAGWVSRATSNWRSS